MENTKQNSKKSKKEAELDRYTEWFYAHREQLIKNYGREMTLAICDFGQGVEILTAKPFSDLFDWRFKSQTLSKYKRRPVGFFQLLLKPRELTHYGPVWCLPYS